MSAQSSAALQPVRRKKAFCIDLVHPGLPGRENWWCPSQEQARKLALRRATKLGLGFRIVHDHRPSLGWPHYHVVAPNGHRVSGHYFYGGRPPRKAYQGRPQREFESL
jgi:hypothetical protein